MTLSQDLQSRVTAAGHLTEIVSPADVMFWANEAKKVETRLERQEKIEQECQGVFEGIATALGLGLYPSNDFLLSAVSGMVDENRKMNSQIAKDYQTINKLQRELEASKNRLSNVEEASKKVTLTKEQADWLEHHQSGERSLGEVLYWFRNTDKAEKWDIEKIVRGFLDGYEVEKEKMYYVKLPLLDDEENQYLNYFEDDGYFISDKAQEGNAQTIFTMDEIPQPYRQWAVEA